MASWYVQASTDGDDDLFQLETIFKQGSNQICLRQEWGTARGSSVLRHPSAQQPLTTAACHRGQAEKEHEE